MVEKDLIQNIPDIGRKTIYRQLKKLVNANGVKLRSKRQIEKIRSAALQAALQNIERLKILRKN